MHLLPNPDPEPTTVVVTHSPPASRRLKVAHRLAALTIRKFINLTVWIDSRGLLRPAQMLAIAGRGDRLAAPLRPEKGTLLRPVRLATCLAEWVWNDAIADPDSVQGAAIVYFHGGALVAGGLNTHRRLVARIARVSGIPVLNVDYRQIPRAHVTTTVEDCVAAYLHLLDAGFCAERIIVAGDSAGGGLAFSMTLAARDRGLPVPLAIVAIAPWADYDPASKMLHANNSRDAVLSGELLATVAGWGMAVDGRIDPMWSPVNHDFRGMPPALIQVSSTEMLLADAMKLAERYKQAARPLNLQIWDSAIHVFQAGADVLPDARNAVDEIGAFIQAQLR